MSREERKKKEEMTVHHRVNDLSSICIPIEISVGRRRS